MSKKSKMGFLRIPLLLIIFGVYFSPFYILLNISFKPVTDLSSRWKFPTQPTTENFQVAVEQGDILSALVHSFFYHGNHGSFDRGCWITCGISIG